ncbi:hypothetical protein MHB43_20325 [Paenibacillus sp. FSL H8-0317]|uniref:hypothetical protein n=1 Tax=Paenibacillus sp. FSL H8-0317 TaxID=2921385 RepID=UPI0032568D7A
MKKIHVVHYIYTVIILLMVIIWLLLKDQLNSSEVVNVISISAGIASIVLAMAAIIYAFYQSRESSKQNRMVQDALIKISAKVEEVGAIKAELSVFRNENSSMMADGFDSLIDQVYASLENIRNNATPDEVDTEKELINSEVMLLRSQMENQRTANSDLPIEEKIKIIANNVLAIKNSLEYYDVAGVLSKNNVKFNPATVKDVFVEMEESGLLKKISKHKLVYIKNQ